MNTPIHYVFIPRGKHAGRVGIIKGAPIHTRPSAGNVTVGLISLTRGTIGHVVKIRARQLQEIATASLLLWGIEPPSTSYNRSIRSIRIAMLRQPAQGQL